MFLNRFFCSGVAKNENIAGKFLEQIEIFVRMTKRRQKHPIC